MNKKMGVYAIIDTLAESMIGSGNALTMHHRDETAIRMFTDVALSPGNLVNMHPEDFSLIQLGYINENHQLEPLPTNRVVLTGAAWKAAQEPKQ